jgi:hypothetical protein
MRQVDKCGAQSGQQHLPALRVLVPLGGGAQLGQAALRGARREAQEAAGVRAHAEDVAVAHDATASRVGIEIARGGAAGVRGLAAAPLEAHLLPHRVCGSRRGSLMGDTSGVAVETRGSRRYLPRAGRAPARRDRAAIDVNVDVSGWG